MRWARRSHEDDIRRQQSSVKTPDGTKQSLGTGDILRPYRNLVGPVHQFGHINQKVDECQDGHSQSPVQGAMV